MNILEIDKITYTYSDGTKALNGVSLEIRQGEKLAFVGGNGSGKSTLFLCLNGILRPQSGTINYNGKPVVYKRKELLELRSKVGIVFQDPDNQLFASSVYQEISFGPCNLDLSQEEVKRRVDNVIEELGIKPFSQKPTHALSGGQKKQVALADILVMEPEVLIMDEPVSALDPLHTKLLNEKLEELPNKGITVIVATHDMNFALEWADRIIMLKDGIIIRDGNPADIFQEVELLKEANLSQPDVITLFKKLIEKKILKGNLPIPRNLKELEGYLTD
ncbi:MAG: cobalt chelatase [Anaerocolumna sp.]|jgi:cobalt/nickel transport system ATP-binding protein|nr:cobalt chelatase [Anaerocolumna sp.]